MRSFHDVLLEESAVCSALQEYRCVEMMTLEKSSYCLCLTLDGSFRTHGGHEHGLVSLRKVPIERVGHIAQ